MTLPARRTGPGRGALSQKGRLNPRLRLATDVDKLKDNDVIQRRLEVEPAFTEPGSALLSREVVAMQLLSLGYGVDVISAELGYSKLAVTAQLAELCARYGARTHTHLVAIAIRAGVIQ